MAKWDRTKLFCPQVLGSIVTAGGLELFGNGRKGSFLKSVQLWQHLRTPLTEGLLQTWTAQQQKGQQSSWCRAIHAWVPPFVPTTVWQEAACCCSGFGNSSPPPEVDFSTSGKHKAECLINCAPNLTGYPLSSVPDNWMADIGSTWKLLIFSCFPVLSPHCD